MLLQQEEAGWSYGNTGSIERGFITRMKPLMLLKILDFLRKADRFHGSMASLVVW